jgi:hypothetical protein
MTFYYFQRQHEPIWVIKLIEGFLGLGIVTLDTLPSKRSDSIEQTRLFCQPETSCYQEKGHLGSYIRIESEHNDSKRRHQFWGFNWWCDYYFN